MCVALILSEAVSLAVVGLAAWLCTVFVMGNYTVHLRPSFLEM